jgi:hypothetical protein
MRIKDKKNNDFHYLSVLLKEYFLAIGHQIIFESIIHSEYSLRKSVLRDRIIMKSTQQ